MAKVERLTYAKTIILPRQEYTDIHGLVEAYGGRVKDCQFDWNTCDMIMFYEMAKSQKEEFEKELYGVYKVPKGAT